MSKKLYDVLPTVTKKPVIRFFFPLSSFFVVTANPICFLFFLQQIQHPTASLIAKVATAQDDITGDGTTSNVLIIGELLKQADLYVSEVNHASLTSDPWVSQIIHDCLLESKSDNYFNMEFTWH